MSKRHRNSARPLEVPAGIVAVFFVIALVIAFAKAGPGSAHRFAGNPPHVHTA